MDKKWFNKIVLIIILLISITTFSYLVMDNNLWNKITFLVVDENVEPLSYYSFEDNFQDSTGDVECTNYGASFVEGKEGKAVSFDGVGDFLTCPGKDVKDFTISLWVKLEEKIWHTLIERGVDGRYGIWYSGSTNQIFLVSGSDPGGWAVSETNDLEDGEWHYIAGIYESGVGASFYVDGIKLDTLKDITSDPIVSGSLVVGGSSRYGGNLVKGELDEIKIRDIVLTPEDIKEEYNSYINQGVECVADTDCSSLDLECKVGKCINDECVQENKVNGTLCDDNLLCSENDVCSLGSCSGVTRDCDDGNVCTDDICDESLGCVNNFNTVSCDDGLFCTEGDVCSLGVCSGVARDCNDNIECTLDSCDEGLGECVNGWTIFLDEDCDNYDDDCDSLIDEDYVEAVTSCGVGECSGNAGLLECINGLEVDDCNAFEGAVDESCEDETGFDSLDNNCDGVIDLDCDSYCDADGDGYSSHLVCAFALYKIGDCDDSNSAINPGADEVCDDVDNNCDDDIDDISRGCSNVCFSGLEVCSSGVWGSCDALSVPGNYNNLCNVGVGECKSSGFINCQGDCSAVALDPREEVCNDLDDDCDGEVDEEDACYVPECVADTDCSSLDLECKVGKCINDECVQENKVDGLSCDDGNICSENDVCSLGSCVGSSRDCDDGNVCTDDVCDESLGCVNNFNTVSCNDNLFCTQGDVCILGSCSGISRSCDDNIECTLDSCDEGLGECVNWLRNSFCNNGLFCDGNEVCDIFQGCLSLNNIGCDDKNKKTYDSCNEDTDSCVNELIVLDDDKDGVPNNKDKCPNSIISALEGVNNKGCVKPKLDKFDIKKNLDNQDLNSVENFEIGIKKFGKIKFNEKVKLIRQNSKINLEDNINISGNRIEINSSALPELNKSAIITLYNINYSSPKIIVDARLCAECNITFWSKELSILEFSVPHFTIYEIFEGYCGDGIIDFDEECDLSNITSTCQDFDYTSGEVACFNNCSLNISGCYDEDTSGGSSVGGGGSKKKSNVKNNLTDLNNITYLNEEGIDNLNESLNSEMIPEEIVKDKSSMKVMIISGVFILVIIIALVVFIYFKLKNKEVLMEKVKINQNRSSP